MSKNRIIEELKWRGFYAASMGDVINQMVEGNYCYIGCDPTSIKEENMNKEHPEITSSLHIGHFSSLMCMKHLQRLGMKPILLVGDYTAAFGDGSFKTVERPTLSYEEISHNTELIMAQLHKIFGEEAIYVRNSDWMNGVELVHFMRDVASKLTVNYLINKDALKSRFDKDAVGLNVGSLIYPILQAYDLIKLRELYGCTVSISGNDQQGNVSTAFPLNQKLGGEENLAAWFMPILTDSNGKKFGKSEGGKNIFLNPLLTSPYDMFQFFINLDDEQSEQLIKMFTFMSKDEIEVIIEDHRKNPSLRKLQKKLAFEVTKLIHSEEEANIAVATSEVLFGNPTEETLKTMDEKTLVSVFNGVPTYEVSIETFENCNKFLDTAVDCGAFKSKGDLRKLIQSGGVSINKKKVSDVNTTVCKEDLLCGKYMTIQKGKKVNILVIAK